MRMLKTVFPDGDVAMIQVNGEANDVQMIEREAVARGVRFDLPMATAIEYEVVTGP